MTMQNSQGAVIAGQAPAKPGPAEAPSGATAPVTLPAIPQGGGRVIIDRQGDRTVFTTTALPPDVMPMVILARDTALGLMGLLAAIVIVGPFARMIARRMERRPEVKAAEGAQLLQLQLHELQQSVDAMSLEVERISESQRFQNKLLVERKG